MLIRENTRVVDAVISLLYLAGNIQLSSLYSLCPMIW